MAQARYQSLDGISEYDHGILLHISRGEDEIYILRYHRQFIYLLQLCTIHHHLLP